MVRMPCFETSCLETGVKTLVTETVASQHILARSIFHCQFTLIAKIPIAKCPIAKIPIAKCPIDKIPIAKCPIAKIPIAKCPIAKCPIAKKHSSPFKQCLQNLDWFKQLWFSIKTFLFFCL